MINKCPGGSDLYGAPTIRNVKCPKCGSEIEIFSNEIQSECYNCGFTVRNDMASCTKWCEHARECIGPKYDELISDDEKEN